MPLRPTSLDIVLKDTVLSADINGFDLAIPYLEDVIKRWSIWTVEKLCHIEIKLNNVLLANSGKAVLCYFTSLTMTEAGAESYVSSFLYRPFEAIVSESNKKVVVNDFSYDAYTMGFLVLDIFTNEVASKVLPVYRNEIGHKQAGISKDFRNFEKEKLWKCNEQSLWGI